MSEKNKENENKKEINNDIWDEDEELDAQMKYYQERDNYYGAKYD